jgi:hypothetical protein
LELALFAALALGAGCGVEGAAGPSPAREDAGAAADPAGTAADTAGPDAAVMVDPVGPAAAAIDAAGAAADAGGDAGALCEEACTATARPACPATQPFAACVSSCHVQLAGRCGGVIAAYLGCLATAAPEQLDCDEAGAPRARPPTCGDQFFAVAGCLTGR